MVTISIACCPNEAKKIARYTLKLPVDGEHKQRPPGDDILADRAILVVPEFICNAGGVTVSYFEWVQDFSSFYWTENEINARLDTLIVEALRKIWSYADRHRISLRTAAFVIACERILAARQERGLYP